MELFREARGIIGALYIRLVQAEQKGAAALDAERLVELGKLTAKGGMTAARRLKKAAEVAT